MVSLLCVSLLVFAATALAQPRPPRNRPAPGGQHPAADAGAPAETPDVPVATDPLQRALEGRREAFLACYEAARTARPELQGAVTLRLRVGPGSRVVESRATGVEGAEEFLRCLEGHTMGLHLDGVMSGAEYSVPLDFHPDR
jgi:hypothetical protein